MLFGDRLVVEIWSVRRGEEPGKWVIGLGEELSVGGDRIRVRGRGKVGGVHDAMMPSMRELDDEDSG